MPAIGVPGHTVLARPNPRPPLDSDATASDSVPSNGLSTGSTAGIAGAIVNPAPVATAS